ncbi:type I-E CRISPR-associated protein Cse1/CasA [Novacetimonas maltaceti]|uniref:CRISPR-associated protein Cse1 n=1 Tax=Novacetimonas maltaceti TaxID=1203393 RepID=A0A2S3W220_9PROT|nr:type I-E CRISPR-associated protein Cse1/CasA [Novacetimonas maltaceti]POF62911.1 CRISPR-associated protein Cse1 [Novacetimonas maltaceti]PYD61765.1 type I-E CRISPR-associated protein Cse1/CasA [Novacetimonas maltaceti]
MNLVSDAWIPVRRRSGARDMIRPAQIVERVKDDPVVEVMWPRADFRNAFYEFLIGLLATACPPVDQRAWVAAWRRPPAVGELDAAFARIAHAFCLDGPGPRFLQDHAELDSGPEPVERLLIEAPGESTIKRNADLFVHRGQVTALGRPAAAMALFTLQSWAPSGGAGNMTGLRGGGPLMTLVLPSDGGSLWDVVWANVPCGVAVRDEDMETTFPWLAATHASGKGGVEVRMNVNASPQQCWWGMPRRIRLDFENTPDGVCDLTGMADTVLVRGWRQRPYGPKYAGWVGMPYGAGGTVHPLTPRYRQKAGAEWLAVHPQPGGVGYRHWAGVVVDSADANRLPASCVAVWRNERARDAGLSEDPRLLAAGFDMDNMKARSFVESEMPLPGTQDEDRQEVLDELARQCVAGAKMVADILRGSVRDALFGKSDVPIDATLLSDVRERFWTGTHDAFFALLHQAGCGDDTEADLRRRWLHRLARVAMDEFDAMVTFEPDMDIGQAQRSTLARRRLAAALAGTSTEGRKLMTELDIPAPPQKKRKTAGKDA